MKQHVSGMPKIISNIDIAAVLSQLLNKSVDTEEGFNNCLNILSNPLFRTMLVDRTLQLLLAIHDLQDYIEMIGIIPSTNSNHTGLKHSCWTGIYALEVINNDGAILQEVLRGERILMRSYRIALRSATHIKVTSLLTRHYKQSIRSCQRLESIHIENDRISASDNHQLRTQRPA